MRPQADLSTMRLLREQLSHDSLIPTPAGAPTGNRSTMTVPVMRLRGELRAVERHVGDADDSLERLDAIAETLRTGLARARNLCPRAADRSPDAAQGRLDTAIERLRGTLADTVACRDRVELTRRTSADRALVLRGRLANVTGSDVPRTVLDLKLQEFAYQSALAASGRAVQRSLLEYLR